MPTSALPTPKPRPSPSPQFNSLSRAWCLPRRPTWHPSKCAVRTPRTRGIHSPEPHVSVRCLPASQRLIIWTIPTLPSYGWFGKGVGTACPQWFSIWILSKRGRAVPGPFCAPFLNQPCTLDDIQP